LFIRLDLDRHVIVRLADDLIERGYEVLTTQQAGLWTPPNSGRKSEWSSCADASRH
jgi:hypothetical protein